MRQIALLVGFLLCTTVQAENWNAWRGPQGDGTSWDTNVPVKWNGATGENVVWKIDFPGSGLASPVFWDNRLFLVSYIEKTDERVLLCLDRRNGKELWRQTVLQCPPETMHPLNSRASSTPTTDGHRVYVTFLEVDGSTTLAPNVGSVRQCTPGVMVVAAYDLDGNPKWMVKPGSFISAHGFCSSPILYKDLVIVNGDHDGDSYIVALDRDTGKTRWKVKRKYGIRSYATPIIRSIDGRDQMVLSGSQTVVSYDPGTGNQFWMIEGPTEQFVASMVFDGELVIATAGYPEHHIVAINPKGQGDVTDTHIAWRTIRGSSYVPSPIVVGKYLMIVSDGGVASCFESTTGKRYWMKRIGKGHSASLISASGLVYFTSDTGITTVVRAGEKMDIVSTNELGENCTSSPSIHADHYFIRGEKYLYCIGAKIDK